MLWGSAVDRENNRERFAGASREQSIVAHRSSVEQSEIFAPTHRWESANFQRANVICRREIFRFRCNPRQSKEINDELKISAEAHRRF